MINNLLTGDAWPRRPGWWCVCEMFFTELLFCFPPLFFLQLIRFRSVPRDLVLISCGVVSFSHVTTPCSSLSPEGSIAPAPNPPTHSSFSHLYFFSFFFSSSFFLFRQQLRCKQKMATQEVERSRSFCARAKRCATRFIFFKWPLGWRVV